MSHQNWNVTVLRKDQPKEKKEYLKPVGDITNEEKPLKKISFVFKKELMQHRQKCGWTQKQLGQKLNVTEAIIKGYENGIEIPNGNLINRMNLLFKTKLPKCK